MTYDLKLHFSSLLMSFMGLGTWMPFSSLSLSSQLSAPSPASEEASSWNQSKTAFAKFAKWANLMDPASIPACPRALEWFHPGPGGRAKTRRRSWSSRRRWVSAWLPLPAVLSPVWWPQRNWHPSSHANCAIAFPMGIIGDTTPNPTKWGAITNRVRSLALCTRSWVEWISRRRRGNHKTFYELNVCTLSG